MYIYTPRHVDSNRAMSRRQQTGTIERKISNQNIKFQLMSQCYKNLVFFIERKINHQEIAQKK